MSWKSRLHLLMERVDTAVQFSPLSSVIITRNCDSYSFIQPTNKWLALIFRRIKFYRLIFQIYQRKNIGEIIIDGPQSLLKQSSRYGMQFAMFLPVLPLLPFDWELQANVLWGKKRKFKKSLLLDSAMGLH